MPTNLVTTTESIDPVFMFIFGVCLVLLIGITVAMVTFVVRYHRSRAPEPTSGVEGSLWLEIAWIALPTLLVLAMFYYGWAGYMALRNVPPDALEIKATARMWSWSFGYANGKTDSKLYVPVGKPVKVELSSADVIHGFYLPAFRVKRDAVPGMKNYVWFVAPKAGSYDLFCSVFCGPGHSQMITSVEALPPAEFAAWVGRGSAAGREATKALLAKYGCLGCHSLDGTPTVGPSFKGIWGRKETVLTGGVERAIVVDGPYVRRSILEPNADVVKGFPPVMPPFAGAIKDDEVKAIVDFLQGGDAAPAGAGDKAHHP